MFETNSIKFAQILKQQNETLQGWLEDRKMFAWNGPKHSIPLFENGGW